MSYIEQHVADHCKTAQDVFRSFRETKARLDSGGKLYLLRQDVHRLSTELKKSREENEKLREELEELKRLRTVRGPLGPVTPYLIARKAPACEDILKVICHFYDVSPTQIKSQRRTKDRMMPRHIFMHLARELTEKSLPEIGRFCGDRDHTTVLSSCRRIESKLIDGDQQLNAEIHALKSKIAELVAARNSCVSP